MDNKLKTVDAETLLSTPMSKTMFIVDGLISQGVNVISGASKIGKSWLMLWLGLQVAQGNSIWGLPTLQCDVLYLSLEDTQRRIKDRLYNLTDSAPDNLYFAVTSGLIGGGLEEQITDFLTEHSATKLVIIDTLQKVRDSKGSAGKEGMYGNDYDDISSIKRIADGFNIAILLVHHLRKLQDSDDPFNDVSGSTGIIGAADTNFILRRKRSGNAATLLVSGRDVEYQELTLQFNDLVWELVERKNSEDTKAGVCSCHSIRESKLTEAVLAKVREVCKDYLKPQALLPMAERAVKEASQEEKAAAEITALQGKITSLTENLDRMYTDRLSGLLPETDFQRIFTRIKEERGRLEERIRDLEQQQKSPVSHEDRAKELVQRFLNTACASRELLVSLIERIELTEGKEIIIKFRFAELQQVG